MIAVSIWVGMALLIVEIVPSWLKRFILVGLTILGRGVSLAFLNLPLLTRISEEEIRAVPMKYASSSYAVGATKFQVLPYHRYSGGHAGDYDRNLLGSGTCLR